MGFTHQRKALCELILTSVWVDPHKLGFACWGDASNLGRKKGSPTCSIGLVNCLASKKVGGIVVQGQNSSPNSCRQLSRALVLGNSQGTEITATCSCWPLLRRLRSILSDSATRLRWISWGVHTPPPCWSRQHLKLQMPTISPWKSNIHQLKSQVSKSFQCSEDPTYQALTIGATCYCWTTWASTGAATGQSHRIHQPTNHELQTWAWYYFQGAANASKCKGEEILSSCFLIWTPQLKNPTCTIWGPLCCELAACQWSHVSFKS